MATRRCLSTMSSLCNCLKGVQGESFAPFEISRIYNRVRELAGANRRAWAAAFRLP